MPGNTRLSPPTPSAARTVHCTDALTWLRSQGVLAGASFVTSLPDVSEVGLPLEAWKRWFTEAAALVLAACPADGVAIFYQTDIVEDGVWIDKQHLVAKAAETLEIPLVWHRIVCRRPAGLVAHGRPGYAHMAGFSRTIRLRGDLPRADVLADGGPATWTRGMGVDACAEAIRFVRTHTESRVIVDPFCGHGTALAVANHLGFEAIGVELHRKRAQRARTLRLGPDGRPGVPLP